MIVLPIKGVNTPKVIQGLRERKYQIGDSERTFGGGGGWDAGMIRRSAGQPPPASLSSGFLGSSGVLCVPEGTGAPDMKVGKYRGFPQHLKVPKAGSTHDHSL